MSAATSASHTRLELMLVELRLPGISRLAGDLCAQSDREGWPAHCLLEALLENEMNERESRRMERHRPPMSGEALVSYANQQWVSARSDVRR